MHALRRLQCRPTVAFHFFIILLVKILTLFFSPAPRLFWISMSYSPTHPLLTQCLILQAKPLTQSLVHLFTSSVTQWPTCKLSHSLSHHKLTHRLTHSFIHPATLTYPLIHSPTHSYQYTHSPLFTYRLSDSLSPAQPKICNYLSIRPPAHGLIHTLTIHPPTKSVTHPHTDSAQPRTRFFRSYGVFISKILRLIFRR